MMDFIPELNQIRNQIETVTLSGMELENEKLEKAADLMKQLKDLLKLKDESLSHEEAKETKEVKEQASDKEQSSSAQNKSAVDEKNLKNTAGSETSLISKEQKDEQKDTSKKPVTEIPKLSLNTALKGAEAAVNKPLNSGKGSGSHSHRSPRHTPKKHHSLSARGTTGEDTNDHVNQQHDVSSSLSNKSNEKVAIPELSKNSKIES